MIHREGYWSLVIGLVFSALVLGILSLFWAQAPWLKPFGILAVLVLMVFLLQFFRNPKREIRSIKEEILCPADGTVVVIEQTLESEFLNKEAMQISIFMSPFNIHKNLNPINGFIREVIYHKGKFLVAFNPKSSTENERCSFLYETEHQDKIVMRQIAGAVARRIVQYLVPGTKVEAGKEMGFIKFGSRVDVFLPLNYEILVNLNDKVKAGQTLLARVKEEF